MLDPPVLLADEDTVSNYRTSRTSRFEDTTDRPDRLDRLDREVVGLTKKLEAEVAARRKLQDILVNSGLSLPPDALLPD